MLALDLDVPYFYVLREQRREKGYIFVTLPERILRTAWNKINYANKTSLETC